MSSHRTRVAAAFALGVALVVPLLAGGPARAADPTPAPTRAEVYGPVFEDSDIDSDVDDSALATINFAGGVGTVATTSVRAATSLTSAGLHIAPRYMTRQGDVDVSTLGGLVNFPSSGGSVVGAQLSLQARLLDGLVALADLGPQTVFGLRGPLWENAQITLGWDARYRSDAYFYANQGLGLSAAGFGVIPAFPGAAAQGGQAALNAEYSLGAFRFNLSPALAIMSNRSSAGAALGADWDLGRFTLGYGADLAYNAVTPGNAVTQSFEQTHLAGVRFYMTDWAYLQANYRFLVADAYREPTQTLLLGVGTRLLGNFTVPPAKTLVAEATPEPEETLPPEEPEWDSLKGRVYHSQSLFGNPGRPLTVFLKIKKGKSFVNAPQKARTDDEGKFVFHRLPDGEYQVVYRHEKGMHNVAAAAVSNSIRVASKHTRVTDLDVAWDDAGIKGKIEGNQVTVTWPGKAGIADAVYEVILKYAPSQPYVVGAPVTADTRVEFDVSDEVKSHKLYFTVKYWKKGKKFQGATFYGQSDYKILEQAN